MDSTAIPGAVCAVHPDQPLSFTCPRCGTFACERCRAPSGELCSACLLREGGAPLNADEIIRQGFGLPFQLAGRLAPFALLHFVPGLFIALYSGLVVGPRSQAAALGLQRHPDLSGLAQFYLALLGPILALSLVSMVSSNLSLACCVQLYGDTLGGRSRTTGELFGAGLRTFLPTLGVNLLRGLGGTVLGLFCCVPGVWLFVMLAPAPAAIGLSGKPFGAALGEAWGLVKSRFWLAFGVECLGWLVVFGGSVVTGGANGALKFLGSPGAVAGALIAAAAGALLPLPLYAMNTLFYVRAKAQDEARAASAPA